MTPQASLLSVNIPLPDSLQVAKAEFHNMLNLCLIQLSCGITTKPYRNPLPYIQAFSRGLLRHEALLPLHRGPPLLHPDGPQTPIIRPADPEPTAKSTRGEATILASPIYQ